MELLDRFLKGRALYLGVAGISIVLLLLAGLLLLDRTTMVYLYGNLSPEDSSRIIAKLQEMRIVHKGGEGSSILVPEDKVLQLRMLFAQEGLPSVGSIVGYEIFDKSDLLGSSSLMTNINLTRALEGELSRTISSLAAVEKARVHLALPKQELFTSSKERLPSASVVIRLKPGKQLSNDEVTGIANLLATGVPELSIDRITIIDQHGRPLKFTKDHEDSDATFFAYRNSTERKLQNTIEEILSKHIGFGKVKASVSVTINPNKEVLSIEQYDPNGQVVRSTKSSDEEEHDDEANDNVSVATNLPNIDQGQSEAKGRSRSRSDTIINYEISKTVSNKVIQWGEITSISAAVVVDGIYELDSKSNTTKYRERTEEELAKLRSLVIAAIGINEKRGDKLELVNLRFNDVENIDEGGALSGRSLSTTAIIFALALLLTVAGVVTALVKLAMRRYASTTGGNLENPVLSSLSSVTEKSAEDEVKENPDSKYQQLADSVTQFAKQHPETSAKILRDWLS